MTTQNKQNNYKLDNKKNIFKRLIQVMMSVILIAIILLVSAGKIDWIYAWVYIASSLLVIPKLSDSFQKSPFLLSIFFFSFPFQFSFNER